MSSSDRFIQICTSTVQASSTFVHLMSKMKLCDDDERQQEEMKVLKLKSLYQQHESSVSNTSTSQHQNKPRDQNSSEAGSDRVYGKCGLIVEIK